MLRIENRLRFVAKKILRKVFERTRQNVIADCRSPCIIMNFVVILFTKYY